MDMPAEPFDHAAGIATRLHIAPDFGGWDHFQSAMAVLFPVRLVGLHLADLFFREGGDEAAMDEIAVDRIFFDAAADDVAALQRHGAELDGKIGQALWVARVCQYG